MTQPGEFDFSSKKAKEIFTAFEGSNLWPPSTAGDGQKMLSFSSPHPYSGGASTRSIAFSTCPDANQSRTGGVRGSGTFTRLKGPFTPSQWMELEHQALIYKHIVANVPVPSNLLAPIRRALYSYGSTASCASNFLGWGPFHLGFSRNNDPEPGRCRRTDGKKWRCSRDAVPDQKYCERHINRGRHSSRKHVEGHTGHAVTGSTSSKAGPVASSSPPSLISSNTASNGLNSMQHQLSSIQPNTVHASTSHLVSRSQGFQGLSSIPSSIGVKSNESSHSEFGIVSSDSLLNPTERISYINTTNSQPLLQFNPKEANNQQSVHHFIDDWPKDQSDGGTSDWTQLSMSIPMAPDFCSSSASPAQEKSILTNVSLSDEVDPTTHMSLGPTHFLGEPIWGSVMGGPLGEVLSNTTKEKWSVKWWRSIQQAGSSPTGVLQKSNFASVSNSSSGGSPLSTDNKTAVLEAVSHCNDLLGSAAIPTL